MDDQTTRMMRRALATLQDYADARGQDLVLLECTVPPAEALSLSFKRTEQPEIPVREVSVQDADLERVVCVRGHRCPNALFRDRASGRTVAEVVVVVGGCNGSAAHINHYHRQCPAERLLFIDCPSESHARAIASNAQRLIHHHSARARGPMAHALQAEARAAVAAADARDREEGTDVPPRAPGGGGPRGALIEVWTLLELARVSVVRHAMVPKHRILSEAEAAATLARLRLDDPLKLPWIAPEDPVIRALGGLVGQVVEVQPSASLRGPPRARVITDRVPL